METTSINPTDIAVIVILLLSALLAFARGLVREVLSVGAWVGAAFATLYLFPHVLPMVQQVVAKELLAKAVAGIGIFVVSLILLSIISHQLSKGVRGSALSAVDRSLRICFRHRQGCGDRLPCLSIRCVGISADRSAPVAAGCAHDAGDSIGCGYAAQSCTRPDPVECRDRAQSAAKAAALEKTNKVIQDEALRRLSVPRPTAANATNADAPAPEFGV